ncbi:hypothetical protein DPMN_015093 [Dreissena polymorpha]|uniref:Uncharacterized protein n=1 Tax=Dreissena polymorpha TaxID=45954 RepID=A0A9D4S5V2_DREPO|nr:hypothetical protein DPMN_015093 [Dreissena polymorpha]
MPRKGKKATDTAKTSKTSGKCTVAETEVTASPQEERNNPPTPPIKLVEEHPYFPDNEVPKCFVFLRFFYDSIYHLAHNCNCSIAMMIKVISEQQFLTFLFSKFQYTTVRDCSTTITIRSCEDLVAIELRSTLSS